MVPHGPHAAVPNAMGNALLVGTGPLGFMGASKKVLSNINGSSSPRYNSSLHSPSQSLALLFTFSNFRVSFVVQKKYFVSYIMWSTQ